MKKNRRINLKTVFYPIGTIAIVAVPFVTIAYGSHSAAMLEAVDDESGDPETSSLSAPDDEGAPGSSDAETVSTSINLNVEANKFDDFVATTTVSELASALKTTNDDDATNDVKEAFEDIGGYSEPDDLNANVSITKVVVETAFNPDTRQASYTLTIDDDDEDSKPVLKTIVVTFAPDWTNELAKLPRAYLTTSDVTLPVATASTKANVTKLFKAIDGFEARISSPFASGVSIGKVTVATPLDGNTRQVVYAIELTDGTSSSSSQLVTITFAPDWATELNKVAADYNPRASVSSPMATLEQNADALAFRDLAGINWPIFSDNVFVHSIVVKTPLDATTRRVTYAVQLQFMEKTSTPKTFTATFLTENAYKVVGFKSFTTSEPYSSLAPELKTVPTVPREGDVQTAFEALSGYNVPSGLDRQVALTKVQVLALNKSNRAVTYRLTFTIAGATESRELVVTFGPDWAAEASKFTSFIASAQASDLSPVLKTVESDAAQSNIKSAFEGIKGYSQPDNLSDGIFVKKVVVKTAFAPATRKVIYTITISDGHASHSFDLTVTFAPRFAPELAKFSDFQARSGTYSPAAIAPADGANIKDLFEAINGYSAPQLASGVKLQKVAVHTVLDPIARTATYTLTLWDGRNVHPETKDVTVTFSPNLAASAYELANFTSTDNVQVAAARLPKGNADVQVAFKTLGGLKKLIFASDVAITRVVVSTPLDPQTRAVVFTVTLTQTVGGRIVATKAKAVTVTFQPHLATEAKKLKAFTTSESIKSEVALLKPDDKNIKTEFEALKSFAKPTFTSGVTISKVVVKTALSANRQLVFTVTLAYKLQTYSHDVTVTFAPDVPQNIAPGANKTLSPGAIAGITIGALAGTGLIGYLAYFLFKRSRK